MTDIFSIRSREARAMPRTFFEPVSICSVIRLFVGSEKIRPTGIGADRPCFLVGLGRCRGVVLYVNGKDRAVTADMVPSIVEEIFGMSPAPNFEQLFHLLFIRPLLPSVGQRLDG